MTKQIKNIICNTQGELYEWAALRGYKFPEFSDIYLKSDFCKHSMDTIYSRFQIREPEEHIDFLFSEHPELESCKSIDGIIYDSEVAYWIGYTYRHMHFISGIQSTELCKLLPFIQMEQWYPGLHTVDEDEAADIIMNFVKRNTNR